MDKQVVKCLYLAQQNSDAGKNIYSMPNYDSSKSDKHLGYARKDMYILRAIQRIIKKPNTGFSFFVTRDNKIDSFLVYFETKLGVENVQISFHSFNEDLWKYKSKSYNHKTVWNRQNTSRDNCIILKEVMKYMG